LEHPAVSLRWNLAVLTTGAALLAGCAARSGAAAPTADGDPSRGAVIINQAQCGACHEIPGIPDAHGLVGPPLMDFGRRTMVAGMLPNTPDALVRWLRDPQSVTPGNGMPDTHLTDRQARDVAAYLYSLR
jgi:cytochrome c1